MQCLVTNTSSTANSFLVPLTASINGAWTMRPASTDLTSWPAGWRWADLLPQFERLEAELNTRRETIVFDEQHLPDAESATWNSGFHARKVS